MMKPNDQRRASSAARQSHSTASSPASAPNPSAQRVQFALAADPRFAGMNAHAEEMNGRVYLVGWVPLLSDRKRMGLVAETVIGVGNVENDLLVGPPNQRPDNEIHREVDDFMQADRYVDPTTIHADVRDGIVWLTGSISTSMYWRYVGGLCWWIPGVRGVRNELRVIRPEPPDDELLAEAVKLMFEKDPLVDVTEIEVICRRGTVTLSGTVGGQDAREAAESDTWALEGVREVVNQIEVAEIPGAPPIIGLDG